VCEPNNFYVRFSRQFLAIGVQYLYVVIWTVRYRIMHKRVVHIHEQLVRVTSTSATWGCVYLFLPGVMATWIVQMAVMSYLDATAVNYSFILYRAVYSNGQ